MALALLLGQSALPLAFEKLWGRTQSWPKQKSRMRRKPSASTTEKEDQNESQETREGKVGYQSWVVGNNGSIPNGGRDQGLTDDENGSILANPSRFFALWRLLLYLHYHYHESLVLQSFPRKAGVRTWTLLRLIGVKVSVK
ncbi:hypothetical protein CJ030_MR5G008777 [Morella rubra]|uniref:Uncharacterized protein n=1 Tax=Morella rubra TaxID=262757 RepID=A0A6A1X076_9ROSI|nr:hypothetical protein CJ030_MR5G008777 [Morella rubra]